MFFLWRLKILVKFLLKILLEIVDITFMSTSYKKNFVSKNVETTIFRWEENKNVVFKLRVVEYQQLLDKWN